MVSENFFFLMGTLRTGQVYHMKKELNINLLIARRILSFFLPFQSPSLTFAASKNSCQLVKD